MKRFISNRKPIPVIVLLARISSVLITIVLVSAAFGVSALARQQLPFKGTLAGVETDQFEPPSTLLINGNGSGNATHLGLFTLEYEATVDLASPTGAGIVSAHFVSANGDTLFCEGIGEGTETIPGVAMVVEYYTITGGTGRFAGAAGAFTVHRVTQLATGVTSGTFKGNIVIH
jgi:hypothetical protein